MPTEVNPLEKLSRRLADARRLLEIHEESTGSAAGRRRNVDVLNRSAMLLAVAAWEGFSEDAALVSATRLSRRLKSKSALPQPVIRPLMFWFFEESQLGKPSDSAKDAMWALADNGWRVQYRKYAERKVSDLNTPNYSRIKKLFSQTLGIENFAENWKIGRYGREFYASKLETALNIRHQIAHGVQGDVTVGKEIARDTIILVERLARWVAATIAANEAALDLGPMDIE